MKLYLLPILAISTCSPAYACDSYVLHAGSWHSDRNAITDVNELNPGLGCREGSFEFGVYTNSYADTSVYLVQDYTFDGLSLFIGVASGYEQDMMSFDGIMPVLGVAWHGEHMTVRVTPSLADGNLGAVFGLSFVQ